MAEMRLIDADALSESIKSGSGTPMQKFFADVCVATAPTVDAVEVVRCKDCKHWCRHTEVNLNYGVCYRCHCKKHENGYCELGERMKNNG